MSIQAKPDPRRDPWELHRLTLDQRSRLTVTSVTEVLHVEGEAVVLRMEEGLLVIRGTGLSLKQLAPEDGRLELRGRVSSLSYEQAQAKGLLRRILG